MGSLSNKSIDFFILSRPIKNKFGNLKNLYISLGSQIQTTKNCKMKRFLFALLCALCFVTGAYAQTATIASVSPTPGSLTGSLLTVGKTYAGTYKDTFTNAGTNYLTIVSGKNGSFAAGPTWGAGMFQIAFTETKISGAPYGNVRVEMSFDGSTWFPAVYYPNTNYQDTTVIDSLAGSRSRTFNVVKVAPYYRLKVVLTGTQVSSWVSQYFLQREQIMSISK